MMRRSERMGFFRTSKKKEKTGQSVEKTLKKKKDEKLLQIVSTQMFLPIRDVRKGIIVTKDGRFIKVLEFSPINFSLLSNTEQDAIISRFAAALRVMPKSCQFKIIARPSDTSEFIEQILKDMRDEPNKKCRELQMEQIELIDDVSKMRSVSRRFIVAFPYIGDPGLTRTPTFEEVQASLRRDSWTIINALESCGNRLISKDTDEYVLELLYEICCRDQSYSVRYRTVENSVLLNYAAHYDSENEKIHVPVVDMIAPGEIHTDKSAKALVIDGLYYAFCIIPSSAYPTSAYSGWLSVLLNFGDGIDVDLWYHKENPERAQRKLMYRIKINKTRLRDKDDTSSDYEDLYAAIRAGYDLKSGLASNDDFCYFGIMLTITAYSMQALKSRIRDVKEKLVRNDLTLDPIWFQQAEAFKVSLPICKYNSSFWRECRRNILTSSLASVYPFVSYELADKDGILMGLNSANSSLVFVNNFDTQKYSNANIAIMGRSGSGKTYTLQCMALRMREKQIQTFIIAPLKGIEFLPPCLAVGGTYIKIAPGSGNNINIMEIRKKEETVDTELEMGTGSVESIMMKKIQQLHTFFSLLLPDISFEEKRILDEALIKTYGKFGITRDNASLIDPDDPTERYKKMPLLGDLHDILDETGYKDSRLYGVLSQYVTGSLSSFNAPTNVDLNNKYVVLDVSSLTKEMLPIGMFIALDYVWDKAREDRTQKKAIFLDETWRLIGPGSTEQAADFVLEIFKVIRGYGGAAIAATQDLNDFFALSDGLYGTGIINNSKIKLLMGTEASEAEVIADKMDLTTIEKENIKTLETGFCLLAADRNHVFIKIQASESEHALITTDREEIRALEKRREALVSAIEED